MVQGRRVSELELEQIRQWLSQHPDWSRWRLSREVATQWDWRNGAGQLKDMAARTLLVKLHERGLIGLPRRRQVPTNRMRCRSVAPIAGQDPIECVLSELVPLVVEEVSTQPQKRAWVTAALGQFHYLDFGGTIGENLQYVVKDGQGRELACLVFGAPAWKCQDRDRFIGWSAEQRQRHLGLIANNSRFLILPWVRVPHLASWALGRINRRLTGDWQAKYGHPIHLVETFVEQDRFGATAYRAANWIRVGETTGRTRQDPFYSVQSPIKAVYLYPLHPAFQTRLCS